MLAAGVNPVDLKAKTNNALYSTGVDGAGVVVLLGECVPEHMRGKRYVFHASLLKMREGHPEYGSFAQYAVVPTDALIEIPAGTSNEDAVALVCPGGTAQQIAEALERNLKNFQRENPETKPAVFVQSASGAVGRLAVQLLKLNYPNLVVIGSASEDKHADLRGLRVKPVTYGPGELERVTAAAQVENATLVGIVDMQGKESVQKHYDAISGVTHATLVCVLNEPTNITESGPTVQKIALGMAYDIDDAHKKQKEPPADIPAYRGSENPVKKMASDIGKVIWLAAAGKIQGQDIVLTKREDLPKITIHELKGKLVVNM
jgi:NADPH:quinone reductase-like Zn-dependent oxidoreductase